LSVRRLEMYVFPKLGGLPTVDIRNPQINDVVDPFFATNPRSAIKMRQHIRAFFDDAVENEKLDKSPIPAKAKRYALHQEIPEHRVTHREAISADQVKPLWKQLAALDTPVALALQLTILTAAREKEVFNSGISEFVGNIWTKPKTKEGREHQVQLSAQAMRVVENARVLAGGSKRLFPKVRRSMMIALLRQLVTEGNPTVHGLRSTFRDWARVSAKARDDVAEYCLDHIEGSESVAAYKRDPLYDERRALLAQWGAFVSRK
jgi:integrase